LHKDKASRANDNLVQIRQKELNSIEIADLTTGATDDLDFSDQITTFSAGYGKLVVATVSHCKVFPIGGALSSSTTSATVDLSCVLIGIELAPRCFCLLSASGLQVCLKLSVHFINIYALLN
jgi:hypothetical protein